MFKHTYLCPLRWSDMDAFGHVNNVVFLRYLEEARIDLMFGLASGEGCEAFSEGAVVARHEIDYLRPLVHQHEPIAVELWVIKLGGASFTIAYEVKDEEAVYARASTVVVPYDLGEGRPRRLTSQERAFLARYTAPSSERTPGGPRRSELEHSTEEWVEASDEPTTGEHSEVVV